MRNQLAEVFEQAGAYRTQFIASDQHCDAGREIGGHGQYIEKAIQSISNQTYANIELLIYDDGSNDRSVELIEKIATTILDANI